MIFLRFFHVGWFGATGAVAVRPGLGTTSDREVGGASVSDAPAGSGTVSDI